MVKNKFFQKLLETKVVPTSREKEHIKYVINRMTRFMQNNPLIVSETIPGGSFGKNTIIRGRAEVDLVYVLQNQWSNYYNYENLLDRLILFATNEFNQNEITETNYGCTIDYRGVIADILVTLPFDSPLIFVNNQESETFIFKPYRIVYQTDFTDRRGTFYQNFVRLIKYWREIGIDSNWPYMEDFKSFLIELIVASVFDKSKNKNSYPKLITEFFMQLENMIVKKKQIKFDDYYSKKHARKFKGWTVNDPADPSYNVVPKDLHLEQVLNYCKYTQKRIKRDNWDEIFYPKNEN